MHSSWRTRTRTPVTDRRPTRHRTQTVIFAGKLREAKEARKLELLARESRHGAGLRMSSSSTARDPLLDEDEDDWVQTSIIAGWSHGYLQMVSLLPAAEKVIAMHAEWIAEAFERAATARGDGNVTKPSGSASAAKALPPSALSQQRSPTPSAQQPVAVEPIQVVPPTPSLEQGPTSPQLAAHPHSPDIAVAEAEDEEVLSFTPKRRRGSSNTSRTGSPAPAMQLPAKTMPSMDSVLLGRPRTPSGGSSDHAPVSPSRAAHHAPSHLVTPAERALRDSLRDSSLGRAQPAPARAQSVAPGGAAGGVGERALSPPANGKTGRSSSSGSLPAPQGAVFIDAKELLRRRRDDVVSGISVHSSRDVSRAGSGSDGEGGGPGDEVHDERAGSRFGRRRTVDH